MKRAIAEAERAQATGRIEFENGSTSYIAKPKKQKLCVHSLPPADCGNCIKPYVAPPLPIAKAKGRIAKPRGQNKLEAEYDGHLFARRSVGEVLWYCYEGITLKLADDTRFTGDFAVLLKNGELEIHETKGPFRREDSFIKLKVAARLYPFRFYLVTKDGDGWKHTEIKP